MTTQDKLTPEILSEQGWKKGGDTPLYVFYTLTLDENFDYDTDFYAYIQLAIGKRDNCLKLDIERTLGDSIHATFRHQITVGEFNTLLEIVKSAELTQDISPSSISVEFRL